MQVFSHTYELNKLLDNIKSDDINKITDANLLVEWHSLLKLMWSKNVTISPKRFLYTVHKVAKEKNSILFTGYLQNDVDEYLLFCIDCFHESLKKSYTSHYTLSQNKYLNHGLELTKKTYENNYSAIHQLFYNIIITELTTLKHKSLSITPHHEFCFNLPMVNINKKCHINDCLDLYFEDAVLDGDNEWYYEKKKKKIPAIKKTYLLHTPDIIIINLKRWIDINRKNHTLVNLDPDLCIHLTKYTINQLLGEPLECIYDLYGICNHSGGVMGGHYYSYVKNANHKWYSFNDTRIKEVHLSKLITPDAYCFFFRKKKIDNI